MDFDTALARLVDPQHEGGYACNPADPGGETYKGISRRAFPTWSGWALIDAYKAVPGFPASLASDPSLPGAVAALYQREFWGPAGCDAMPDPLKFDLFDCAVNSGVRQAVRLLQRATHETEDGILGPLTLQAVQSMPAGTLRARFNGARLAFMAGLSTWPAFSRGWALRIADNLLGD